MFAAGVDTFVIAIPKPGSLTSGALNPLRHPLGQCSGFQGCELLSAGLIEQVLMPAGSVILLWFGV